MRRGLLFIAAALLVGGATIGGCGTMTLKPQKTAVGPQATENRQIGTFDSVRLEGAAGIEWKRGNPTSLIVEGKQDAVENTITEVAGGTLVVSQKQNLRNTGKLTVRLVSPSISKVELLGAGNVTITDVDVPSLDVLLTGAGSVSLAGTADEVKLSISGTGNVDAKGLKSETATVSLSGAGNVDVFASSEVDLTLTGVGNITYYGSPKKVVKKRSGVGSIGSG
jgi:hypothetical protein